MFQFFKSTIIVSILSEFGWDESTLPPTPPIPPPLVMIGSTLEGQPTVALCNPIQTALGIAI